MLKLDRWLGSCDNSAKVRLAVYILTLCHHLFVAFTLLTQDLTKAKDPLMHVYATAKWKLLTTWFNLLQIIFIFVSIYSIWNDFKLDQSRYVRLVNRSKDFLFTSILVPITAFGDILFWCLYNQDEGLVMPSSAVEYISIWNQHSLHTVTLLFVLFELIYVPRKRPRRNDMIIEIIALTAFLIIYGLVCVHSTINGEYLYPFIRIFPTSKLMVGTIYVYIGNLFFYTAQWVIVDMFWGQRGKIKIH